MSYHHSYSKPFKPTLIHKSFGTILAYLYRVYVFFVPILIFIYGILNYLAIFFEYDEYKREPNMNILYLAYGIIYMVISFLAIICIFIHSSEGSRMVQGAMITMILFHIIEFGIIGYSNLRLSAVIYSVLILLIFEERIRRMYYTGDEEILE